MIKSKYLLIIILTALSITGCNSSKYIVSEVKLTPELRVINQHFYNADVSALLSDYSKHPNYKDYIYNLIFVDSDIKSFSNNQLKSFANQTNDPKIKDSFQLLIKDNEINQIYSIKDKTPLQISEFCRSGAVNTDLLEDYINSCYIDNIDSFNYKEVKYLAICFQSTRFNTLLNNKCNSLKVAAKKEIIKEVDDYLEKENAIVEQCIQAMARDVKEYLITQRLPIIKKEIKDSKIPRRKKKIKSKIDELISENISTAYIDKICKKEIQDYTHDINNARNFIINNIGGEISNTALVIPRFYHDNIQLSEIDISLLTDYNNSRNKADAKVAWNWVKGLATCVSDIISAYNGEEIDYYDYDADAYEYAQDREKKEYIHGKEDSIKDDFIIELKRLLKAFTVTYIENVAKYYIQSYTSSQEQYKKTYYEQY